MNRTSGMKVLYINYKYVIYLYVYLAVDSFLDWCHDQEHQFPIQQERDILDQFATSVWCRGSRHTERMCIFRNLCYRGDIGDFIFFHGPRSTALGVPESRYEPPLVDLSSVSDHGAMYFSFVDLPSSSIVNFDIRRIESTTLIMSRLNPDNIMHVFHDDLVPIFSTARELCSCDTEREITDYIANLTVFFADGRQKGQYWHLYRTLLTKPPILSTALTTSQVQCFEKAVVGLQKGSTWYQYGFKTPQGPIPEHLPGAGAEVARFAEFFRNSLHVPAALTHGGNAVLLSRTQNRRILNQDALLNTIEKSTGLKAVAVDSSPDSVAEVVRILGRASLLVAMHGSALVLSMFLRPGSTVLELFPYAVNPDHYTPYKTLAQLRGIDLSYASWRNANKSNSVAHPEREPRLGGIAHLTPIEQRTIVDSSEVPPHVCCADPQWLFRIYQDTIVDDSIVPILDGIRAGRREPVPSPNGKLFPGFVRDLDCAIEEDGEGRRRLSVSWTRPWNVDYIPHGDCRYELWLQAGTEAKAVETPHCRYSAEIADGAVRVWVRAICANNVGGFGAFPTECTVD